MPSDRARGAAAARRRRPLVPALAAAALLAAPPLPAQEVDVGSCLGCHAADGAQATPETPLLGGQPEMFLLYQLVFYRDGQRKAEPMTGLMSGRSNGELSALAAEMAKLPAAAPQGARDDGLFARGEAVAEKHRCGTCHRPDYSGGRHVPRLAGQREAYLLDTLHAFRAGERIGIQAAMAEVLSGVSDDELEALAHYLSHVGGA